MSNNNDNDNNNDNNRSISELIPVQVADKFYCPKDQLLLRFKSQLGGYFCADCGSIYVEGGGGKKPVSTTPEKYSSRAGEATDPNLITMEFIPLGRQPDDGLSKDPDVARMQLSGWVLTDSQVDIREEGTFNAQQFREQRDKYLSRNKRNGNTYSVF